MGNLLKKIESGISVKAFDEEELQPLCKEIREFLVSHVLKTGGHLSSNLGAVELTVAIHRVFDTSKDRLVFDVGHQSYTHKILTGRMKDFDELRKYNGLSGFPQPSESIHDAFIAGHASNSVSVCVGLARARTKLRQNYNVLAVIGDGALTGGLALEALNDAGQSKEPMIVILNDNGMSIDKNVGALGKYLSNLRIKPKYTEFKEEYHNVLEKVPAGKVIYKSAHNIKNTVKKVILPGGFFENIGFTYIGPIDGHDMKTLVYTLERAKDLRRPVLLHVRTVKGKGYLPAEEHPEIYHGIGANFNQDVSINEESFSSVFGSHLIQLAEKDERICAITPAMCYGTGLKNFKDRYPQRYYDVGISEEHAVTMAAGMAKGGLKPVCAIYSTFLQRSFDMIIHDVCIQKLPVVFAIDRAGIVGEDGPTHNGVFDVSFLSQIPNMTILSPSNYAELKYSLEKALTLDGPVAVRYPKGKEGNFRDNTCNDKIKLITEGNDISILTYGRFINNAIELNDMLKSSGISAEILKLNELKPIDYEVIQKSVKKTKKIAIIEEGNIIGGIGQQIFTDLLMQSNDIEYAKIFSCGDEFLPHGDIENLLRYTKLDTESIYKNILKEIKHES